MLRGFYIVLCCSAIRADDPGVLLERSIADHRAVEAGVKTWTGKIEAFFESAADVGGTARAADAKDDKRLNTLLANNDFFATRRTRSEFFVDLIQKKSLTRLSTIHSSLTFDAPGAPTIELVAAESWQHILTPDRFVRLQTTASELSGPVVVASKPSLARQHLREEYLDPLHCVAPYGHDSFSGFVAMVRDRYKFKVAKAENGFVVTAKMPGTKKYEVHFREFEGRMLCYRILLECDNSSVVTEWGYQKHQDALVLKSVNRENVVAGRLTWSERIFFLTRSVNEPLGCSFSYSDLRVHDGVEIYDPIARQRFVFVDGEPVPVRRKPQLPIRIPPGLKLLK